VKRRVKDPHAEPVRPSRDGPSSPVAEVLRLQRSAGNRAVVQILRQPAPPGPPAPKTVEQQWADDWADPTFSGARAHFRGTDRPVGTPKERYDVLCPLYRDQGIPRPLTYVKDEILDDSEFFGQRTPMHKDLMTALKAAEATLRAAGVTTAPFSKCWAFNPRTQTGGQWSNHADGKAIDIDEATNPRLLDAHQRTIISALTDMDISAANPGAAQGLDSYDANKQASSRFQDRYSAGGIAARVEELADEEGDLDDQRKDIADALGLIPTGKHGSPAPTADQKAAAAALHTKLTAKQAEIKAAVDARKALESEHTRVAALDKAVEDLEKAISKLQSELAALNADLEQLAKAPPGAATDTQIHVRKAALATKATAIANKQKQLARAVKTRGEDPLHSLAAHGFLDLNKAMVVALKGAGLRWGGDYKGPKDFMHFEVVH
jgi:D-alanyl-D-alanine carboxypeptidase